MCYVPHAVAQPTAKHDHTLTVIIILWDCPSVPQSEGQKEQKTQPSLFSSLTLDFPGVFQEGDGSICTHNYLRQS